jgi:hypothetical protein
VREVDAVGIALGDERQKRADAIGGGVEVLDPVAIAAQPCALIGDRAQVVEVVAVAGGEELERGWPGSR